MRAGLSDTKYMTRTDAIRVIAMKMDGDTGREVAEALGLKKSQVTATMVALRQSRKRVDLVPTASYFPAKPCASSEDRFMQLDRMVRAMSDGDLCDLYKLVKRDGEHRKINYETRTKTITIGI